MTLQVITQANKPAFLPPIIDLAQNYFTEMRHWLHEGNSPTGRELVDLLEGSDLVVGIALVDTQLTSMYVPPTADLREAAPEYDGGLVLVNIRSPLMIGNTVLPIEIGLAHEMGHAAQYVDQPAWFMNLYDLAKSDSKQRLRRGAVELWGTSGNPMMGEKDLAMYQLENLNVARWEATICTEKGLPYRKNYE